MQLEELQDELLRKFKEWYGIKKFEPALETKIRKEIAELQPHYPENLVSMFVHDKFDAKLKQASKRNNRYSSRDALLRKKEELEKEIEEIENKIEKL